MISLAATLGGMLLVMTPFHTGPCEDVKSKAGVDRLFAATQCTLEFTGELFSWFTNKADQATKEEAVVRLRSLGEALGAIESDKQDVLRLLQVNRLSRSDTDRHVEELRRDVEKAKKRFQQLMPLIRQEQRPAAMVIDTLLNDALTRRKTWIEDYLNHASSREALLARGDTAVRSLRAANLALLDLADSVEARLRR